MRNSKRRILLGILITVIAIGLFIPYETTLIPQYTLKVLDENGLPVEGILIKQSWSGNLITAGNQSLSTDDNGFVTFPKRNLKSAALPRLVSTILNFPFKFIPHVGGGTYMFISFSGNSTYQEAGFGGKYKDKDPPEELILEKWK